MSPIVANCLRQTFPLKSFFVGVIVMVGSSDHLDRVSQTFQDNVLTVSICRGQYADWLPIVIADHRRPLYIIWKPGLLQNHNLRIQSLKAMDPV